VVALSVQPLRDALARNRLTPHEVHGTHRLQDGGWHVTQPSRRRSGRRGLRSIRESGYRLLMEVLAARGNIAEALREYEELRVLLRDELGATPSPQIQALHLQLLKAGG
jgi:hypothetical protein